MLGSSFLFSQEHLEDFERMVLLLLKRVDRGAAQIFVYLETKLMNLYFLYFLCLFILRMNQLLMFGMAATVLKHVRGCYN